MSVDLREPVHRLKGMRPLRDQEIFALATKGEGGHSVVLQDFSVGDRLIS
jgi:hypothetical protein